MADTFPYYYHAFGLKIASGLFITAFEPAEQVEKPDVIVQEGIVPDSIDPVINKGVLFESNDHEFLLRLDSVAAYYIRNGSEIIVQRHGRSFETDITAFIIGMAFGALLHQRRLLPLHAGTVVYNNKCILLMGVSGAGKSTLAAAFVKKGALLAADDISVIDFSSGFPAVIPAFPSVKIWEDSLRHLEISAEGLKPVREELKKYHLPIKESFATTSQKIEGAFVLNTHNKPEIEIKFLSGIDKFQVVKKHTYLFRSIPNTGIEEYHFRLATDLASKIPVWLVTRPNSLFDTDSLIQRISDTLS